MEINVMNFVSNLYYIGVGMFGIFVVIGVIVALTMLLNHITKPKE